MPYQMASDQLHAYPPDRSTPALDVVQLISGMESDTTDLTTYAKALRVYVPSTVSAVTLMVTPAGAANDTVAIPITVPPGAFSYEAIAVRRIWSTGSVNLYAAGVQILLLRA